MEGRAVRKSLMPTIGDVIFLSIFLWTLHNGLSLLNDGDTGWHIVTGENIIRTHKIPVADPYSYTMPGTAWTAHEWLAEVIMAAVHRAAGLNGVVLMAAAVIGLTFMLLYKFMLLRSRDPLAAAFVTALAASASTLHWLARPHVFSFPLTLAFFIILELYQREGKDRLKFLPVLMAVWVNLHAGYMLGLMLLFIYAGGNLFLSFAAPEGKEQYKLRAKRLAMIFAITLAAACLNPHGPAILYFPFHLVGREYIMDNIQEWLSPNFHVNRIFELLLLFYAAVFVLARKKPDLFEGAAALLLVHMSLYSARYIPLLALVVSPMAAVRLEDALARAYSGISGFRLPGRVGARLKKTAERIGPLEARPARHAPVYITLALAFGLALSGGQAMGRHVMDFRHDGKIFPVDAVQFVTENNISGNMFNNDGWGGYIIYKTYPRHKVFFDGRSDMYGVPFMKEFIKVVRAEDGYDKVLDKYNVTWVLFNADSPITRLLLATGRWKLVYADETAAVILKDIPENRRLIEKYRSAELVTRDGNA